MRICEVCGSHSITVLHQQNFVLPGIEKELFYTVVSCDQCGFVYADSIAAQSFLDSFYKSAEHHLHVFGLPEGLSEMHGLCYDFIVENVPNITQAVILDIGSSMGHFLNLFKRNGITNVLGLEPSQSAKNMAKETYGIEICSSSLSEFAPNEKYSLITLSGVLEHIANLNQSIAKISELLADEGYLFLAVPDAAAFSDMPFKEPFLEFALEHINFFTKTGLNNLFSRHGFELVTHNSIFNDFYCNNLLLVLFKKSNNTCVEIVVDSDGVNSVKNYISKSKHLLSGLQLLINQLRSSQEPLIVWGAGAFATRICATTALVDTNLIGFVDQNLQIQALSLLGKTIHPPEWLKSHGKETVLVASTTYATEIKNELINKYAWQGRILLPNDNL